MEMLRTFLFDSEVRKMSEDDRSRAFILSTRRKDSHNTILPILKWDIEDFNKAGAFYYQHNTGNGWNEANPDNALGPAKAMLTKDALEGIGTFEPKDLNELADKILRKVDFGTMKTTSVGFFPTKDGHWGVEKDGEDPTAFYFDGQRLVEFSIVHIPSNPDAIKKSMESYSKYMLQKSEQHNSEGFKKDYSRMIRLGNMII